MWVQLTLLTAYLIGSFGILILAAVRVGDAGALLHPGLDRLGDPEDSLPGAGNPLVGVLGVCRLVAWFVYPLGIAMISFGVVTLVHSWRRDERRRAGWLAALTASWLVLVLVAASPYGGDLITWLLH
ncbi:hypothetical protein ACWT_5239 [Actinoplanes sp. SE50]|nr:hypothetical protein ACPL_5370 [Actinoplanes sp. SE50/110]ATO84654.1 hypothetical protein ACWT_5239 [Actinoplanes sp. SE50]SLM02064.1 hypothetical protein ACSP50_5302 [Actinoplanes sp. SE50/110]